MSRGSVRWVGYGVVLAAIFSGCKEDQQTKPAQVRVGITYIVDHALLREAKQGFIDELSAEGFVEGKNLKVDFQSAQGNRDNAIQIIAGFLGKVDLIYTISTPSTKAATIKTADIPIVFSAVTDPQGDGIVSDLQHPGGNVTGVSNFSPADQQRRFLRLVVPGAKRLGIPYDPGEPSAVSTLRILQLVAPEMDVQLVTASVPSTSAVAEAVSSLTDRTDAIYVLPDNTIGAAINVVADICSRRGVPMLSSESDTVKNGKALASLTVDHYTMGQDAGAMAVAILRGRKPGDIPVRIAENPLIHVSRSQAAKLRIVFSAEAESAFTFVK